MKPADIRQFRRLLAVSDAATPRFLMRWIAWEAIQFRTLVVVAHSKGWSVAMAEEVLDDKKISSMGGFEACLTALLCATPKFVTPTWDALLGIERIRNKLVHGVETFGPNHLDRFSDFLEFIIDKPSRWNDQGDTTYNPFQKLTKHAKELSKSALESRLRVNRRRAPKSVQSLNEVGLLIQAAREGIFKNETP